VHFRSQVVAPGGDFSVLTAAAPKGAILGTWPAKFSNDQGSFVVENGAYYSYLQVAPCHCPCHCRCHSQNGACCSFLQAQLASAAFLAEPLMGMLSAG